MRSNQEDDNDLSWIVKSENLNDSFSKKFLMKYFESGFGSMTKHDIDLLIYHLISNEAELLKNKSNYDVSNLLKITEAKVRNIQLESYLKYSKKNNKECLQQIKEEIKNGDIKPELDNDKIKFLMDSSIQRREFEHAIKSLGHVVDYSFNKDIVSIKLPVFISVIKELEGDKGDKLEKNIIKELKTQFKDNKEIKKIIEGGNVSEFLKERGKEISLTSVANIATLLITDLM